MKWKQKDTDPRVGQTRQLKKFAWLPVKLTNGMTVWMEIYFENQTFIANVGDRFPFGLPYWKPTYRYQQEKKRRIKNSHWP